MSNDSILPALLIGIVCALAIIGLLAYARGPDHHRGDEIGTHGTKVVVTQPAQ